jgi:polygalacturonase
MTISVKQRVASFTIRPAALNVSAEVSADEKGLRISLPTAIATGVQLVVNINSLPMVVIMLDQWDESLDEFHASGRTVLDVTQTPYNADPTGHKVAGTALQQALDDARSGNVILVPPGVYCLTHTLNWTASASGATLFLQRGATLRTVGDRSKLYMVPHTKYFFLEPLMVLKGAVGIAIRGRGNLDANGFALMGPPPKDKLPKGGSAGADEVTWAYRRRCLDSDYR